MLAADSLVLAKHYSSMHQFKGIVLEASDEIISIKLTKEFCVFNIFEQDPIVLGYNKAEDSVICECSVPEVSPKADL